MNQLLFVKLNKLYSSYYILTILISQNKATAETTSSLASYRIPFKNSSKFPKDARPYHLQHNNIFDNISPEAVTSQLLAKQTEAMQEATLVKQRKMEKITAMKPVNITEGIDEATNTFHPQRYALRPPVGGPSNVLDQYPVHWPEGFHSMNLSYVGLDNQVGQRVIKGECY